MRTHAGARPLSIRFRGSLSRWMTALRAAAPISTSVQRKLTAAWSLLFWRPPGRGRSQLAAFVDDVDGTGGPPSRGADIGADHRHHERRYRDSTQQQRQSGVTVQQRCRTEASDEDGRHDRVPRLTTAQLLRTALRRSRYQRRPIRVTVTHHGSIIDRDYRRAHLRPTSERAARTLCLSDARVIESADALRRNVCRERPLHLRA